MIAVVSGASGYIGQAVAEAFRRHGYRVYGLVRSLQHAKVLRAKEIEPTLVDLQDLSSCHDLLQRCDVFAHCALSLNQDGTRIEQEVLTSLCSFLAQKSSPTTLLYTSGCFIYGNTQLPAKETDLISPLSIVSWRPACEQLVLKHHSQKLSTTILRPGFVYGRVGGVADMWFSSLQQGSLDLIEGGNNHWSMVHLDDLAEAFVLAHKKPSSRILNVTDGNEYLVKEIIEKLSSLASTPCQIHSLSHAQALEKYGSFAEGLAIDQILSNATCRKELGWEPFHQNFLEELDIYYKAWNS